MCDLDMTHYPFDWQSCAIDIENWAYPQDSVDLLVGSDVILLHNYRDNGIWHLASTSVTKTETHHDTDPNIKYPMLVFTMNMQRKPGYYMESIVIPCLLILVIALSVFWLPPDAGEKVSLGITVLLAFSVFQLVINSSTPATSDYSPIMS